MIQIGQIWGCGNNEENQFGMMDYEEDDDNDESQNMLEQLFQDAPDYALIITNPVCITSDTNHPLNGIAVSDIDLSKNDIENYGMALDNTGKVYYWGYFNGYSVFPQQPISYKGNTNFYVEKVSIQANDYVYEPTCINTLPESTLADVVITKISAGYGHSLFLDSEGKIWSFGKGGEGNFIRGNEGDRYDTQMPRCINDFERAEELNTEYTSLDGVVFSDISAGYSTSMAIDTEGNVWSWGYNYGDREYIRDTYNVSPVSNISTNYRVQKLTAAPEYESNIPVCLSKKADNPLYGVKAKDIAAGGNHSLVLDTTGKIWGWGNESYYRNEEYFYDTIYLPEQLGTEEVEEFYNKTMIDICAGDHNVGMIDSNGKYYVYGYFREFR